MFAGDVLGLRFIRTWFFSEKKNLHLLVDLWEEIVNRDVMRVLVGGKWGVVKPFFR